MRIIFMGTPASAAASLEALLQSSDEVVAVVTQPDRPSGRGQITSPSPVRQIADQQKIPVLTPFRMKDPNLLEQLQGWQPDLIVVVAYGRILPGTILNLAPLGCVNVHYSLLPKYRGAAPMQWAIFQGEAITGVTTMQLVEEMDAGPILLAEEVSIKPGETVTSLEARLVPVGARLLMETVSGLAQGRLTPRLQDAGAATFAPMLRKEDGLIDWTRSVREIERGIRAFTPWPSAFTYWEGKRIKIHGARLVDEEVVQVLDPETMMLARPSASPIHQTKTPGTVVEVGPDGIQVAGGEGVLLLTEVQAEGRKRMPAEAFVRGSGLREGVQFEQDPIQESA